MMSIVSPQRRPPGRTGPWLTLSSVDPAHDRPPKRLKGAHLQDRAPHQFGPRESRPPLRCGPHPAVSVGQSGECKDRLIVRRQELALCRGSRRRPRVPLDLTHIPRRLLLLAYPCAGPRPAMYRAHFLHLDSSIGVSWRRVLAAGRDRNAV